ncbi:MAG: D-alanine--D-alanine ligase [Clostridia bacterium]|nr:D-alanine--D-alanine ligase [Clostridia bacterium]
MKIVVLCGGLSPERNVSLTSGRLVTAALCRKGHRAVMVDLYEGLEMLPVPMDAFFDRDVPPPLSVGETEPDLDRLIQSHGGRTEPVGPNVIAACKEADVVFLALHGATGENGQLQALLDMEGICYTGSGYIGSLLAMDKDIAKKLLRAEGILTPDWVRIDADQPWDPDGIIRHVGLPAVIKPCSCGSSVGVTIVHTREELNEAVSRAAQYEKAVMAETMVIGRELTCGILSDRILPPVEIIPKNGFYDYQNKYQAGATTEICPAPISEQALRQVTEATRAGFSALRLEGYARFDYMLDHQEQVWCLEANTLPGMTPTSLLPQEAAAVGMDYDTLCEILVLLAKEKRT